MIVIGMPDLVDLLQLRKDKIEQLQNELHALSEDIVNLETGVKDKYGLSEVAELKAIGKQLLAAKESDENNS
jgi:hypothetical protein